MAEQASLGGIIENDPGHQSGNDDNRHRVGSDNEIGMGTQIHARPACIICMARTRRRKISLRMAARCSVRNSSVKAPAITISGVRIDGSMVEPPMRNTDAGWCSV